MKSAVEWKLHVCRVLLRHSDVIARLKDDADLVSLGEALRMTLPACVRRVADVGRAFSDAVTRGCPHAAGALAARDLAACCGATDPLEQKKMPKKQGVKRQREPAITAASMAATLSSVCAMRSTVTAQLPMRLFELMGRPLFCKHIGLFEDAFVACCSQNRVAVALWLCQEFGVLRSAYTRRAHAEPRTVTLRDGSVSETAYLCAAPFVDLALARAKEHACADIIHNVFRSILVVPNIRYTWIRHTRSRCSKRSRFCARFPACSGSCSAKAGQQTVFAKPDGSQEKAETKFVQGRQDLGPKGPHAVGLTPCSSDDMSSRDPADEDEDEDEEQEVVEIKQTVRGLDASMAYYLVCRRPLSETALAIFSWR